MPQRGADTPTIVPGVEHVAGVVVGTHDACRGTGDATSLGAGRTETWASGAPARFAAILPMATWSAG